ncbi:MAG: hypothetical protein ACRETO_08985 [Gammaproteobacteria bacterium]
MAEKESDGYATSRVIPLQGITLRQFRSYSEHRSAFLKFMDDHELHIMPETWLFYMENGRAVPVTPGRLAGYLGSDYPFPLNAQRHYLRTRLRELGVAGTFVDALLGHGALGEEPYGRYSGISPTMLRRAIDAPMLLLLEQMGLKFIKGMTE